MKQLTKHITKRIVNRVAKKTAKPSTPTLVNKIAIILLTTFFSLSQMACSSTDNSARYATSDYQYAYQKSFGTKSVFSPITRIAGKQDFQSDRQLMVALLNRETTEDQTLMQSFTETENNPYYVGYTSIRGPKVTTNDATTINSMTKRTSNFTQLIAQDRHVVSIRGRY
jgi:hypothetical protein